MKKTFKVVMLPTEKASKIHLVTPKDELGDNYEKVEGKFIPIKTNKLLYTEEETEYGFPPQHLYIISDDEIKEGDWLIGGANDESENEVWKHDGLGYISKEDKKIVATTDKSLTIKSNYKIDYVDSLSKVNEQLPQLPESFIQSYIKAYNEGKPITEVDLEMQYMTLDNSWDTIKTRPDNTVVIRETKLYNFEDLCLLSTFIRENNHKWEGKGITNTEIIEQWKKNGEI